MHNKAMHLSIWENRLDYQGGFASIQSEDLIQKAWRSERDADKVAAACIIISEGVYPKWRRSAVNVIINALIDRKLFFPYFRDDYRGSPVYRA